jgi:hypothetical protein
VLLANKSWTITTAARGPSTLNGCISLP